ncbi:MAG: hypothetical protein AB8G05_23755 [Oligoflexales bacterium]
MNSKNSLFFLIFLAQIQSSAMATGIASFLYKRSLGYPVSIMRFDVTIAWKYEYRWKNNKFIKSVLENLDTLDAQQSEDLYENRSLVREYLFSKISNNLKLELANLDFDEDIQFAALFISFYTSILKPAWDSHPLKHNEYSYDNDYDVNEYIDDFNTKKTQLFHTQAIIYEQILKISDWYQIIQQVPTPLERKGQTKVDENNLNLELRTSEHLHLFHELRSLNTALSTRVSRNHFNKIYEYLLKRKLLGRTIQKKRNLRYSLSITMTKKPTYPLIQMIDEIIDGKS